MYNMDPLFWVLVVAAIIAAIIMLKDVDGDID